MILIVTDNSVELHVEGLVAQSVEIKNIVVDYNLLGDPVAIEAFDFKRCPFSSDEVVDASGVRLSFDASVNAAWIVLRKERSSSDQEELDAEFGFDSTGRMAYVKFDYEKGRAAAAHRKASQH
ncbi:MAG: hypothetical protein M0D55_14950 [Elusimicrobiota bacterium]|nr:MAG: hypothetical protein M0D55_14950 [Elusimicrobiota bacterium]